MKLTVYIAAGILLYLGVYGYLKTRGSIGFSPMPGTTADFAYHASGLFGHLALIAYLVGMVIIFHWWLAILFFVIGGLLTGAIYSRLAPYGAGLAVICVPLGIVVAGVSLLL